MWNSVFLVVLAIGGSLAMEVFRDCDTKMCDGPADTKMNGLVPTEEELKLLCSPMLERFECLSSAIKDCTGKNFEEWSTSDNKSVATFSTLMMNLGSVGEDICDEDSLLHKGYVSSVKCFSELMNVRNPECREEAVAIYHAFVESQKLLGVVKSPVEEAEDADCMVTAYAVACFTIQLREQCGEVARGTMVEILRRIQYVSVGLGSCNNDQLETLRSTYLEFTELEEQKKSWFSEVFNSRK